VSQVRFIEIEREHVGQQRAEREEDVGPICAMRRHVFALAGRRDLAMRCHGECSVGSCLESGPISSSITLIVVKLCKPIGLCTPLTIERTVFTLQRLSEPELRQRSHASLNKGEASNSRRVRSSSTAKARSVTGPSRNQSFRSSGLSLITAATQLRSSRQPIHRQAERRA
jgi:hypothetical protein